MKDDRDGDVFIGWDVGGWNCDHNSRSRDALVILDGRRQMLGTPWRGNLRETINAAGTTPDWVRALFTLCRAGPPPAETHVTLAIDTPLGFSDGLVGLISGLDFVEPIGLSHDNPYLFRETERYLFRQGLRPLSAIKDMIGSQATKGMHVLAKFAPQRRACGVWTDGDALTVIEAYPSACKGSATMKRLRAPFAPLGHEDKEDALTCALIGWLFAHQPDQLVGPPGDVPVREGWIWAPADGL